LPEGKTPDLVELRARRGIGHTLGTNLGWASSEYGSTVSRNLELWERVGYPPEYASTCYSLCTFSTYRSDLPRALQTAERLSQWSQSQNDIRGRVLSHMCFGRAKMAHGELAAARSHLQQALDLYRSSLDDPTVVWTFRSGMVSRGVVYGSAHADLAVALCLMGYPEQALAHIAAIKKEYENEVRVVSEPHRLWDRLRVLSFLCARSELIAPAERMAAVSREHGLPYYGAQATIMFGYAVARCGDPETGRAVIGDALAAYTATETVYWSCYFRALLAETYQMTGETDEALHILTDALEGTERTGERWYTAELHRHIGEAHLQRGAAAAAQHCFEQALAVARSQGAKLWELQATTSLARLLRDQGKPADAGALLAPVYAWFTEGFDTVPLRDAKAVIDELAGCSI
jgi:tetratricopeptide (TPR) repeat protein